jgi:hypothetical protein
LLVVDDLDEDDHRDIVSTEDAPAPAKSDVHGPKTVTRNANCTPALSDLPNVSGCCECFAFYIPQNRALGALREKCT